MFALTIATASLVMVVIYCFITLYVLAPNNLLEIIVGFILFLGLSTISGIRHLKKYKENHKLLIQEKKKVILTLDPYDIKDFLLNSLFKYEIFTYEIYEIIAVLKITETEKRAITKEIIDTFENHIKQRSI